MSHLEEQEVGQVEELIFPCDGRDGEYLRIMWDHDVSVTGGKYLWVESVNKIEDATVWRRIHLAIRILRRKEITSSEIILSPESSGKLYAFFKRALTRGEE